MIFFRYLVLARTASCCLRWRARPLYLACAQTTLGVLGSEIRSRAADPTERLYERYERSQFAAA